MALRVDYTLMKSYSHSRRSRVGRASLTLVAGGATVLAVTVALATLAPPAASEAGLAASTVGGLSLKSPKHGKVTLRAGNLAPGQARRGTVTLRNDGGAPVPIALSRCRVRDVPGPNGGVLSTRLTVKLVELAQRAGGSRYVGRLGDFSRVALGSLGPNETRTYAVTVAFADGGNPTSRKTGDNAFQGASTAIDFCWTRRADA